MDHRAVTIDFLRSTGLIPVKVRPNQKDPFPEWDPRRVSGDDHGATIRQLERDPKLNVGALFFGKYVDVDIDTNVPTLTAALDIFLPKTPWVWGRASKPRSHRAYVLHEDFDRDIHGPTLRFMKALKIGDDNYSVEVRGGKPENGLFTVMPGSWRDDAKEMVEWSNMVDTSVSAAHIPTPWLLKRVRMAQATALLATYFTDGVRNDMSLAIAGVLWRIRSSSLIANSAEHETDLPEDTFILTEDDCDEIFKALLVIADPNKADRRQRELNYTNTWNKLSNDPSAKVTGGKVLAELIGAEGEKVVRALYRLLSDNDGIEALEKLAEQFVVWYGQGVLLDLKMVEMGRDKPWMTREQATNSLGGQKITINNKKIAIVNLLFGSSSIQRVGGLTFDPSTTERITETEEGAMVNQWRGFQVQPVAGVVTDDDVRPFLDYLNEVVASGDPEVLAWVTAWVADMFQFPGDKPGTALVLVGVQGAGKTFLGEQVIGKIIGKQHYVQMNSINTLVQQFNSLADNKIFTQCDEAIHSYQKDIASKLKSLITDESIIIEPKGINSFRKPNLMRFLFTSNEEKNPIFIDPSPHERRFTVIKVSACRATDLEYWTNLREWMKANLDKVLRWLLSHQYDRKLITRPIQTSAKRQIQRLGVDPEVSWILNRISQGFPIDRKSHEHWWHAFDDITITDNEKANDSIIRDKWPNRVHMPVLESDFREYVRQHGRSVYSGSVMTVLRQVFPPDILAHGPQVSVVQSDPRTGQTVRSRIRTHHFPTKEQIIDHLKEKYGDIIVKLIDDAEDQPVEQTPTREEEY